ncbi:MAG: ornithine cyclodeaminase, partial [Candidatus Ranarchaeia archaeon]
KKPIEILYLSQEDVKKAGLDIRIVNEAVEEVFKAHTKKEVILPYKIVLDLGERERGRINAMPAYVGGNIDMCGIKWIAGFPGNPKKYGIPRAHGIIIINNSWTGLPLAIMDGTLISAMRTGAATGVGAKYLARKDSEIVAIIGCGVQARTQIASLKEVIPSISEVRGYDIRYEAAQAFANEIAEKYHITGKAAKTPREAVEGADIIVTVTVADEPIVKNAWVKKGSFFAHVGSYQEEEFAVVQNSDKLVVDDWEQVLHRKTPVLALMAEKGLISPSDIHANIGEIILGQKPGRETPEERIFYAPIGMGSEDVAVATYVYNKAKRLGIGRTLPL